jgi:hypothetical protein
MNNININYAYKSGVMEGILKAMTYCRSIPGVQITDSEAFKKFIAKEITRANKYTMEYSKTNPN